MRTDDAILQINDKFTKSFGYFSTSSSSTSIMKRGFWVSMGEKLHHGISFGHYKPNVLEEKVSFSLALWQQ